MSLLEISNRSFIQLLVFWRFIVLLLPSCSRKISQFRFISPIVTTVNAVYHLINVHGQSSIATCPIRFKYENAFCIVNLLLGVFLHKRMISASNCVWFRYKAAAAASRSDMSTSITAWKLVFTTCILTKPQRIFLKGHILLFFFKGISLESTWRLELGKNFREHVRFWAGIALAAHNPHTVKESSLC